MYINHLFIDYFLMKNCTISLYPSAEFTTRRFFQLFCLRFLERQNEDPNFLSKVLFTDEATFTHRDVYNFQNKHV